MKEIKDLRHELHNLTWVNGAEVRSLQCTGVITNAIPVLTPPGIAVIELSNDKTSKAYILNGDGSLRCKISSPYRYEEGFEPYYFLYEENKLTLVFASTSRDFSFNVNPMDGSLSGAHETR